VDHPNHNPLEYFKGTIDHVEMPVGRGIETAGTECGGQVGSFWYRDILPSP
jgi:hypothetical protein